MRDDYRPGDYWRICDRCGFKVRASQTRKEWTGQIVCLNDFEERHPQDFVRGRKDHQTVPDPRPEGTDNVIGPLMTTTTAAAVAGATSVLVESTVRMASGDRMGIALSSGDIHFCTLLTVASSTQFTLTPALQSAVASGAMVADYTATASVNIG